MNANANKTWLELHARNKQHHKKQHASAILHIIVVYETVMTSMCTDADGFDSELSNIFAKPLLQLKTIRYYYHYVAH